MITHNNIPKTISITTNKIVADGKLVKENNIVYTRGYAQNNGNFLFGNNLTQMITDMLKQMPLVDICKQLNGIFQIVILSQSKVELANDRYGFYPLFYNTEGKTVNISTNSNHCSNNPKLNNDSLLDMATLGYVQGNQTLLTGVQELKPHTILTIQSADDKIQYNETSYWKLEHQFKALNEKQAEKQFVELWHTVMKDYTQLVSKTGKACYLPLSGGLDSRLLAFEMDKANIPIYLMSLGFSPENYDIKTALKISTHLNHKQGHFLQYNNANFIDRVLEAPMHSDRNTCGYFSELFNYYFLKIMDEAPFYMPGHSGDFMSGSHLRNRMKNWNNHTPIIDYITRFKSSRLAQQLSGAQKERFNDRLQQNISLADGAINGFIRWDIENRQRRYIVRSCMATNSDNYLLLLPYFDNRLMDFFLQLPMELLLNQRLFVNCNIKYLYQDNKALIKIQRDRRKLTTINNNYWAEFYPKLKGVVSQKLGIKQKRLDFWSSSIDWHNYINFAKLYEISGIDFAKYELNQLNYSFLYNINQLITDIEEQS